MDTPATSPELMNAPSIDRSLEAFFSQLRVKHGIFDDPLLVSNGNLGSKVLSQLYKQWFIYNRDSSVYLDDPQNDPDIRLARENGCEKSETIQLIAWRQTPSEVIIILSLPQLVVAGQIQVNVGDDWFDVHIRATDHSMLRQSLNLHLNTPHQVMRHKSSWRLVWPQPDICNLVINLTKAQGNTIWDEPTLPVSKSPYPSITTSITSPTSTPNAHVTSGIMSPVSFDSNPQPPR